MSHAVGTPLDQLPKLQAFLHEVMEATFATVIDDEGTVHAATMLCACLDKPLRFYFVTDPNSEKCRKLKDGAQQKAACVAGTVSDTAFTVQMRGFAQIV